MNFHETCSSRSSSSTSAGASRKITTSSSAKKYNVVDQRDAIRKINETTKLLKQELSIEYREAREVLSPSKKSKLQQLQQQSAMLSRKIEVEKKKLQKVEQLIAQKTQELQSNRESAGSIDEKRANAAADNRRVQGLENRLENCLVKKNEAESENKTFLAKVDSVRKDRVVFDSIYKKLEKEVFEYSSQLRRAENELERVEALKLRAMEELMELQAYGDQEQANYDANFAELKKAIDQTQSDAVENIRQVEMIPEDKHISGELSAEDEKKINRRAAQALWKRAVDSHLIEYSQQRVAEYEHAFKDIAHVTGISDPSEFVNKLVGLDEANFNRFKYIEELNQEIKELDSEIEKLNKELEKSKTREGIATNFQEKAHVRRLNAMLDEIEGKNQAYDLQNETLSNELAKVKTTTHTIYNILAHNSSRTDEVLGNHGVTDSNLIQYLGEIEKLTIELIQNNQDSTPGALLVGEGPTVLATAAPGVVKRRLAVVPPSASEVVEDLAIDEPRPLTHSELLHSAQQQQTQQEMEEFNEFYEEYEA